MTRDEVFDCIRLELDNINKKWGRSDGVFPASTERKLSILTEEVGEVAKDINDYNFEFPFMGAELVQVAAVAVAWLMAEYDECGERL